MKLRDYPVYVGDYFSNHLYCNHPDRCGDGEFDHPGQRRSTVGEVIDVIKKHAKESHGINLEDTE